MTPQPTGWANVACPRVPPVAALEATRPSEALCGSAQDMLPRSYRVGNQLAVFVSYVDPLCGSAQDMLPRSYRVGNQLAVFVSYIDPLCGSAQDMLPRLYRVGNQLAVFVSYVDPLCLGSGTVAQRSLLLALRQEMCIPRNIPGDRSGVVLCKKVRAQGWENA
jgi:hypothetical protein